MSKLVEESVVKYVVTPEEELEKLKNKELWFKTQIQEPDNYLNALYSTDSPKKDNIAEWAENLERQHELELQLNRKLTLESVGQISSYIKAEMRGLGVHQSTMGYVHEILGYKYKNDRYNTSDSDDDEGAVELRHNSSNPIANYELENEPILNTIKLQQDFLNDYRNKARSSHILSRLDNKQRLKYEEINLRIRAGIFLAKEFIDDRQSVPILAQLKLTMAIVAATNNYASGQYVSQVKVFGANRMESAENFFEKLSKPVIASLPDKFKALFNTTTKNIKTLTKVFQKMKRPEKPTKSTDIMTSKQSMKIVFGVVKKVLEVFEHKNRDEAILDGFYGVQCIECGSWRIKEKEFTGGEWICFCYKCECKFEAKTVIKCWNCHLPLFEEILDIIKKTAKAITGKNGKDLGARDGKCPRCEKDLILPAKMFIKPKLRAI